MTNQLLCVFPYLELGGAEKFNLDMLGQLARLGWRATIATTVPSEHPWRAAFAAVCDDIVDIAAHPPEELPARLLQLAADRDCTHLLVSNSVAGYHALPYLRAHLPGVACLDYCHMEQEDWMDGGFPRLSLQQAAALDTQIVSSEHLRAWMLARGGDPARVAVCTTNIDAGDWDPAPYDRAALRAALGIPADATVALYAGRLHAQKQPLLALDVMRDVARWNPELVFLIAGDGQYAPYVRGFVRSHGLERQVRFLGPQSNGRVRELLAASDILFLPSQMEGVSLAIYEAMAMGVTPVSADVGGQAELVTPECGVLVRRGPREREEYVAALLYLAGSPARLAEMGRAARQRVREHFPLEQMGRRMDALLHEAARRRAADQRVMGAEAALHSARAAIAATVGERAELGRIDHPARRWLRARYWEAVERGAWRLERLRQRR